MNKTKKVFLLNSLTLGILCCISNAHALTEMTDGDMRVVDGQDGIQAAVSYSQVEVDQLYWQDQAGNSTGDGEVSLSMNANDITFTRGNVPADQDLGVVMDINTGSTADANSTAGIDLNVRTRLGHIEAESLKICESSGCTTNDKSMGRLEIDSSAESNFRISTTDGLFNKDAVAELDIGVKGVDVALVQKQSASVENALLMKDLNFNFSGKGNMYVDDVEGFVLRTGADGYADFNRVDSNGDGNLDKPGLNLEFMMRDSNGKEMGLLRAGANGRMVNGQVQFRGVDDSEAASILGTANGTATTNSNAGSTGVAFRLVGEFTNDQDNIDNPTTLELGGAGNYAYGIRFSNLTPLVTRQGINDGQAESASVDAALNTDRALLDTGSVYFNLVDSNEISLPVNTRLTEVTLGNSNNPIATEDDFKQTIANTANGEDNPYSVVTSIRGLSFEALSRRGEFIATEDVTDSSKIPTSSAKWGLGLPIYNMNSNFAFYGKTSNGSTDGDYVISRSPAGVITSKAISGSERLGFSGSISTTGRNDDGSKTTSILLIDGGDNSNYENGVTKPTDYYFGLRNIDMLLNGYGSIGFEDGQLNVSMPKILMVMSTELAAGYLPGAKYKNCGANQCYAPSDGFTRDDDVLIGLKMRLGGSINMALIPRSDFASQDELVDGANKLSFIGVFELDSELGNSIQILDPVDKSTIGFDNISGSLAFDNSIAVNRDSVDFNIGLQFNPNKQKDEVFRVRDINFYPAANNTVGSAQRLGEMAITGGRLNSSLSITPRDGAFQF